MQQLARWWCLVREVTLCVVATILFPVLMFQQGFSGRFVTREGAKNRNP